MVKNFLKREKRKTGTKVLANGRIIVTPFSLMEETDFPQGAGKEMFFLSPDGKIIFDSEEPANESLIEVFQILVQHSRPDLEKWERKCRKRFPGIRTAEDLTKLESNEDKFIALAMLCIPGELNRRRLEKMYY